MKKPVKIDLESPRYYRGLGDIVMWAWLAEGGKSGPDPLVFHRKHDLELMELLGLQVEREPGGISLDRVYQIEKDDGGGRPRVDYIREFLNLRTPLARPTLNIANEDEAWAAETAGDGSAPLLLLFPQSAWKAREWPANYWVDLAWNLKQNSVRVMLLIRGDDARFHNTPHYRWNTPLPRIAALMRHAALVIGNDSFPAHLAGTVGVPTLALMGPTRPTVFAHIPDVECMTSTALDCTGCHFQTPFRAACDQGCMSLYRLFPDQVLRRALNIIRMPKRVHAPKSNWNGAGRIPLPT